MAGVCPEYREYYRMHSPDWMILIWNYVVQSVFPEASPDTNPGIPPVDLSYLVEYSLLCFLETLAQG
jgi:hypothetical protein